MIINEKELRTIITDPNGAIQLVEKAKELGQRFAPQEKGRKEDKKERLSSSQIRAIFGEVRQIEAQWHMGGEKRKKAERRLILLKPKMAYRARKERSRSIRELVDILTAAIDMVVEEKDDKKRTENFTRFVEFFEAILAYHKAFGGD